MVKPYSSYCSIGSETAYSFANGESFSIGEGLNGGYCMYYVVYDKNGNYYKSDYYIYYFDNSGPVMSYENIYDNSKYYNSVNVNPEFNDNYSELKNVYYLWSKQVINEEDYLIVKNNGKAYGGNVSSSELNEDGTYYLYFLAYDSLGNYKFFDLGVFNIDTTSLGLSDVIVETYDFNENYSNTGKVKVSVSEMEDNEEFKCGFFKYDNVSLNELVNTCYNNQLINLSTGLDGIYDLFVYVHDRANNYSLLNVSHDLKIDTTGPVVSSEILYNDDNYHLVNEITLTISDTSGVNEESLKYGWFLANKSNVIGSDLTNSFISGEKLGYPSSYYGEYKLYIRALDNLGNEMFISLDKVFKIDTDVIRISLIGDEKITLLRGEEYKELGAKAYKGEVISGGRVSEINVEGNVDTSKAGTYYITYSSGEGDLKVSVTRTIVVKNDLNYIIVFVSLFTFGVVITCVRLFIRRKND